MLIVIYSPFKIIIFQINKKIFDYAIDEIFLM